MPGFILPKVKGNVVEFKEPHIKTPKDGQTLEGFGNSKSNVTNILVAFATLLSYFLSICNAEAESRH